MRLAPRHTIRLPVMKAPSRLPATSVHLPGTFRAFRDHNYRLLWPANLLAYSSRWMQMTLLAWFVLELTDSELRVALVGVFAMMPMLLLGLVGGMLADATDRKRLLMGAYSITFAAALVMTVLLWTGSERFWHAYVVILVAGIAWAFDMPARRSLVHDLLGSSGVTNGVALDSMGQSVSMMAGPALAGGLITILGVKGGYLAVTAFQLTSLLLVTRLELSGPQLRRSRSESAVSSLAGGLRYVWGNQALRATVLVTLAMNVLMFPYTNLVPVIARDVLHVGPGLMGVLQSASGLGAAIGAVSIASWLTLRYHGRVYLGGAALACTAVLLFSLSEWYALSFPLLLLVGLGTSGFSTMQSTIVMLIADQDMRGKSLGVITIAIGTAPLGAFALGVMAERIDAPFAIRTSAAAGIVLTVLISLIAPDLRRPFGRDDRLRRRGRPKREPADHA